MIVSRKTASSCQEQGGFSIGHLVSAITHILAKKTIVKKSYFVIWVIPLSGNAIKLSGRTFLAPHRGSCPEG